MTPEERQQYMDVHRCIGGFEHFLVCTAQEFGFCWGVEVRKQWAELQISCHSAQKVKARPKTEEVEAILPHTATVGNVQKSTL